jgi:hypothetical protein
MQIVKFQKVKAMISAEKYGGEVKFNKPAMISNKVYYYLVVLFLMIGSVGLKSQTVYYIDANSGSDTYTGAIDQPFKTLAKGVSTLGSNIGTIYLRAGTFATASKISLSKSGQVGNYIKIWAYSNEKVIIDFTGISTNTDGFSISGNYYHLKGLDIRFATHNGIKITGSNNFIENCITRNSGDTGLNIAGSNVTTAPASMPSYNLILNCDSFYNFDPPIGGNADGFSAKWWVGPGNIFKGCRSWNNSDDGWDLWMCRSSILIERCYSFRNGVDIWHLPPPNNVFDGNGNGIKLGGNYVATPHIVRNCLAFDNAGNGGKGFDENHNTAGQTLFNCTSFRNKSLNFALNENTLVSGTHTVKNCISYLPGSADNVINATQEANSWQGFTVSAGDFESIDTTGFAAPRDVNGWIPVSNFLQLKSGSTLIDAGVDVGIAFLGTAPDLGAFEFGYVYTGTNTNLDSDKLKIEATSYPNPFISETTISYKLSVKSTVTLCVYNNLGQMVSTLVNETLDQGTYKTKLNTQNWGSGIYFYVLRSGTSKYTGKMIKI